MEQLRNIVLASSSERRKSLLDSMGLKFEVAVGDYEEIPRSKGDPRLITLEYAKGKVESVKNFFKEGETTIIGADTLVYLDQDEIIGKPKDKDEIRRTLRRLSGRSHSVVTSMYFLNPDTGKHFQDSEFTSIRFKNIFDDEIEKYIESKEPFGKAGSYAIQGRGYVFAEIINGSFTNVVGFPRNIAEEGLRSLGAIK